VSTILLIHKKVITVYCDTLKTLYPLWCTVRFSIL